MKTPIAALLAAATLAALLPAHAQPSPERREAMKQKWDSMTPEQQEAAKEKMKKRWDSMTPEQQEAAKKRFAERHPGAAGKMADKAASAPAAAPAK